jgi:hypothetical protein
MLMWNASALLGEVMIGDYRALWSWYSMANWVLLNASNLNASAISDLRFN